MLIVLFSWTDSKSRQHLVPCVIYYGLIHWKTLEMRKPQNILLTIVLGVAHISIGKCSSLLYMSVNVMINRTTISSTRVYMCGSP